MNILEKNRQYIKIGILLGLLCTIYAPVLSDLVKAWDSKPQSSHGYLIIPICLYLVYAMRREIVKIDLKPSLTGIFFVITGIGLYLIGTVGKISTLSNVSLIVNIVGVLLSLGGKALLKKLLFPLMFLLFMFPVPDSLYIGLTAPLKLFTSSISVDILKMFGFPVLQQGNIIQLPNLSLAVVEACSGLRSLTSYIIIGVLFAYLMPSSKGLIKIILIAIALPIAITVNVLRIVATGYLSIHFGKKMAVGFFHEFSGMIVFSIGLLFYIYLYCILRNQKRSLL